MGEDSDTAEWLTSVLGCALDDDRKISAILGADALADTYSAASVLLDGGSATLWPAVRAIADRLLSSRRTLALTEAQSLVRVALAS